MRRCRWTCVFMTTPASCCGRWGHRGPGAYPEPGGAGHPRGARAEGGQGPVGLRATGRRTNDHCAGDWRCHDARPGEAPAKRAEHPVCAGGLRGVRRNRHRRRAEPRYLGVRSLPADRSGSRSSRLQPRRHERSAPRAPSSPARIRRYADRRGRGEPCRIHRWRGQPAGPDHDPAAHYLVRAPRGSGRRRTARLPGRQGRNPYPGRGGR